MEKLIKEWLEELPEPYRTQALEIYHTQWSDTENPSTESLDQALITAFVWEMTPQGYEYWNKLHEELL